MIMAGNVALSHEPDVIYVPTTAIESSLGLVSRAGGLSLQLLQTIHPFNASRHESGSFLSGSDTLPRFAALTIHLTKDRILYSDADGATRQALGLAYDNGTVVIDIARQTLHLRKERHTKCATRLPSHILTLRLAAPALIIANGKIV